jgi:hypothetical protein
MSNLVEIVVNPDQLVLDPNNPRLFDRPIKRRDIPVEEILSETMQEALLKEISKQKHGLDDLIYSIQSQGFVDLDALLVKPLKGTDKYLVMEGNRRTAAIKTILRAPDIHQSIKNALNMLAVKELHLEPGDDESEEVERIIAMRHLSGPREWTPIARASAIYNSYMRQHRDLVSEEFSMISQKALIRTEQIIGISREKVKRALYVFAIYKAASEEGCGVRPDHYSLLELLVGRPKMASEYFEFNRNQLKIFRDGLSKIDDFFLAENRLVNNPGEFRKIYRAFVGGGVNALDQIRDGILNADQIVARQSDTARHTRFKHTLDDARELLSSLSVSTFRGTDAEAVAIMSLKRLIDDKFVPLAQQQLGLD